MATIGGVTGNGLAVELRQRDGRSRLSGQIQIPTEDYPRVGAWLESFEPVEYRGPVERDGRRRTESCAVVLMRVGGHEISGVSVYFEDVSRPADDAAHASTLSDL